MITLSDYFESRKKIDLVMSLYTMLASTSMGICIVYALIDSEIYNTYDMCYTNCTAHLIETSVLKHPEFFATYIAIPFFVIFVGYVIFFIVYSIVEYINKKTNIE